jgi:hypothetical protein
MWDGTCKDHGGDKYKILVRSKTWWEGQGLWIVTGFNDENRAQHQAPANMARNLPIPYKLRDFLTRWPPINNLRRRTQLKTITTFLPRNHFLFLSISQVCPTCLYQLNGT